MNKYYFSKAAGDLLNLLIYTIVILANLRWHLKICIWWIWQKIKNNASQTLRSWTIEIMGPQFVVMSQRNCFILLNYTELIPNQS